MMTNRLRAIVPALATVLLFALAACDEAGTGTETGEIPPPEQAAPSQ